jgi:hypothetical protein
VTEELFDNMGRKERSTRGKRWKTRTDHKEEHVEKKALNINVRSSVD